MNEARYKYFSASSITKFINKTISASGCDKSEPALGISKDAAAFNLTASFDKCPAGPYKVYWRVLIKNADDISTGVHFTANVTYSAEADPGSPCDVSMSVKELKNLAISGRWFDLEVEEIIIVQPHIGTASVELHFYNTEFPRHVQLPELEVERVELRPLLSTRNSDIEVTKVKRETESEPTTTRPLIDGDAPITRLAVSKHSTYVASLSVKGKLAIIAITDLGESSGNISRGGHVEFLQVGADDISDLTKYSIGLAISTSGSQIAIYQEPKIGDWQKGSIELGKFAFKIYNNPLVPMRNYNSRTDTQSSMCLKLIESISVPDSLKRFVGYCAFLKETAQNDSHHSCDNGHIYHGDNSQYANSGGFSETKKKTEFDSKYESKFVACNGLYLDIYGIDNERIWTWSHSISLVELVPTISRRITCRMMMSMISPNLFMWLEDGGICCSVWDLYTGTNISYISANENSYMGKETRYNKMSISPSESIIALAATNGTLTTFDTKTGLPINTRVFFGIKIEHIEFHGKDNQLLVILRNSGSIELSSRILDPLLLVSETETNQLPVPVIGSTILAFFNVTNMSNKGYTCEAYGSKINFYESHEPEDQPIDPNVGAVEEISNDRKVPVEHEMYKLDVRYHQERLPERLQTRYWVHHVEVTEYNRRSKREKTVFMFIPEPWMRTLTTKVLDPSTVMNAYFLPDKTRFAVVGMQTLQIWMLPTTDDPEFRLAYIWSYPKTNEEIDKISKQNREHVGKYYKDISSVRIVMDITGVTESIITINDARLPNFPIPGPEYISDFIPGVIGMRHAIKPCFETIHLLANAHAFCTAEIEKYRQLDQDPPFYYVKHANAIIRFTKVFLNRRIPSNCALYIPNIEPLSHDAYGAKPNVWQTSQSIEKELESQSVNQRRTLFSNHPFSFEYTPVKKIRLEVENYNDQPKHVTLLTTLLDHTKFHKANHAFVKDLLKADGGCWVPGNTSNLNPLKHAIKMGNRPLVEAIIDYGVKNAKQYHPAYLLPAMQCLKELSVEYPDLVKRMFKMSSYTPAHNHGALLNHAHIAVFRRSNNFDDYKKLVFSLRYKLDIYSSRYPNQIQSKIFTHKVYVCYPEISILELNWRQDERSFNSIADEEISDNPSLNVTLRFKWNRYAFKYWFFRFLFVLSFIILIVTFTVLQITATKQPSNMQDYSPEMKYRYLLNDRGILMMAITIGFTLLLYEAFQCFVDWKKYLSSFYNYVDVLTYSLSIVGAATFLNTEPTGVNDTGPHQNTPLSFAILCLTLTLLFELRVFKELGIAVNIIIEISKKIFIFFCVFLLFIMGFTLALQHLLHTRRYQPDCFLDPVGPNCPKGYFDNYPSGYFRGLADTFFFIAGRYDSIGDSIDNGAESIRWMVLIFYMITVILFLNILIALMNDAYISCRNQGEVGWLIHLFEIIKEVERVMMWKFTPVNVEYFPDYIYYYATEGEAIAYESKYQISSKSNLSPEHQYLYDNIAMKIVDISKERGDYESDYNGRSAPISPTNITHNHSLYNSHRIATTDELQFRQRRAPRQTTEGLSQSHQSSLSQTRPNHNPRRSYTMDDIEADGLQTI